MMDNILKLAALQDSRDIPLATEDAIALLFAERYALEMRYVAAWGWWLSYDGTRWTRDETLHAFDRARAICREIAADCEGSARAVASAKTVAAVERLAKADRRLAATAPQWDANGWGFNTGDDDDGSCDV
jgi:putative DNA primase/helicase